MAGMAVEVKEAPDIQECLDLIERIAASSHLRRASRLQELLHYLGNRSLRDHCESLHEQTVGIDVFGRREDYDTSVDNIVRTSISELRKRIDAYFSKEGVNEPLVMEIPRWNYALVFRYRLVVQAPVVPPAIAEQTPHLPEIESHSNASQPAPRWVKIALTLAGALILVLSIGGTYFWVQYRNLHRSLYGWQEDPTVSQLWSDIRGNGSETDIVLADASFGLVQDLSKRTFTLDDYLNHNYINELRSDNPALNRIVRWNLGSQDDFKLAHRILSLDPLDRRLRLYSARDYMPDLTNRDNVILIGGNISNPWDELFEGRMNFTVKFDNDGSIMVINHAPLKGEPSTYSHANSVQYCVVGFLPNPSHHGQVLLVEGTGAEATEAAGNFLFSEDQLSAFAKKLHERKLPYFEVLLRVSSVQGTPLTATVEAYRAYPNLH